MCTKKFITYLCHSNIILLLVVKVINLDFLGTKCCNVQHKIQLKNFPFFQIKLLVHSLLYSLVLLAMPLVFCGIFRKYNYYAYFLECEHMVNFHALAWQQFTLKCNLLCTVNVFWKISWWRKYQSYRSLHQAFRYLFEFKLPPTCRYKTRKCTFL